MDGREARRLTDCDRYTEMMSLMVDGELDESQKTQLLDHLSECADCRRTMSAFAFLSLSMREDEEAPASLKADVMEAVRQHAKPAAAGEVVGIEEIKQAAEKRKKEKTAEEKKRGQIWTRVGAMAACLAVVVFAAARSGALSSGAAAAAKSSDAVTQYSLSAADYEAESDSGDTFYCAEPADTGETSAEAAPTAAPESTVQSQPVNSAEPTVPPAKAPAAVLPPATALPEATPELSFGAGNGLQGGVSNDMMAGSNGANGIMSLPFAEISDPSEVTEVIVDERGSQDDAAFTELTDAEQIAELHKLITFVSEYSGEELEGEGNYTVIFVTDSGDCRLTLWTIGQNLYCLDAYDGIVRLCAGTPEQLRAFISAQLS